MKFTYFKYFVFKIRTKRRKISFPFSNLQFVPKSEILKRSQRTCKFSFLEPKIILSNFDPAIKFWNLF